MYHVQMEINAIHRELTTEMLRVCKLATAMKKASRPHTSDILTEIAGKLQKLLNRLEDASIALPVQDSVD